MKKYTKRIISIILTIGVLFTLVGCGNTADTETTTVETNSAETNTAETITAETGSAEANSETNSEETGTDNGEASDENSTELIILVAASLTDVCDELKGMYEADHSGVTLTFSYAGSGALQTQIEEGAPADIFISAALKQMDDLKSKDLMKSETVVNLLENKVVLITPSENAIDLEDFADVKKDDVKLIGIGDVESVPAGQYAKTVFTNMGIWDDVEKKANFGTDVRTVLNWVETAAVDCGVVYATDAYTSDKVKIVAEAPEGSCDKVIYPAGVVAASKNQDAAEEFLDFLKSDEAMKIFEKYGFIKAE